MQAIEDDLQEGGFDDEHDDDEYQDELRRINAGG